MREGGPSALGRLARAHAGARSARTGASLTCRLLLAAALLFPLTACDRSPGDAGTSASDSVVSDPSPTDSGAATDPSGDQAMSTAAPSSTLPTLSLVTPLPAEAPLDPSGTQVTQAGLVTILSQQLTDAGRGAVQTVVCSGGVSITGGAGATCTATLEGAGGDQTWQAYPTRAPDGNAAILLLQGQPLSVEFAAVLAAEGTAVIADTIDATYGSDGVGADRLRADAQAALRSGGSPVELSGCAGTLAFAALEPVDCQGSANGAPVQTIVLPGSFLTGDRGLVIVTRPAS